MGALTMNNVEVNGRKIAVAKAAAGGGKFVQVKHAKHAKPPGTRYTDEKTLFVGGLPQAVTEDELRKMFSQIQFGEVTDVRLVLDKKGRSKGYGYVDMDSDEALTEAISLNGTKIENRAIKVARSKPTSKRVRPVVQAPRLPSEPVSRNFQTRALAKKDAVAETSGEATGQHSDAEGKKPPRKSNDDFRAMFLSRQ